MSPAPFSGIEALLAGLDGRCPRRVPVGTFSGNLLIAAGADEDRGDLSLHHHRRSVQDLRRFGGVGVWAIRPESLAEPDPRVDYGVQHVCNEVHYHIGENEEESSAACSSASLP